MSVSETTSPSGSATATATSTATDLRPVIAAAKLADQLSAKNESSGIISGTTILVILLGCIILWVVVGGIYTFMKRKRVKQPTILNSPKTVTLNPMINPPIDEFATEVIVPKQSSPPLPSKLYDGIQKHPSILSVSTNQKIVSGVIHAPVILPSPQLKPRTYTTERRDLYMFQATTVRNMRPVSRVKQIRREEL